MKLKHGEAFYKQSIIFDSNSEIQDVVAAYAKYGIVILQEVYAPTKLFEVYNDFYKSKCKDREINKYNGVDFCVNDDLPEILRTIENVSFVYDVCKLISKKSSLGILGSKLLVKDSLFSGDVALHQDSCYQLGSGNITCFYLLNDLTVSPLKESAVKAYVGTAKFGHLGDAGRLNKDALDKDWPIIDFAHARGTYILMNPHTWHWSEDVKLVKEFVRSIYTFTYSPVIEVCVRMPGSSESLPLNLLNTHKHFKSSRVMRILDLEKQLIALNTMEKE